MNREQALETIRIELATYGYWTREALRAFIENRVSRKAADKAAQEGRQQYERMHPEEPCNQ